MLLFALFFSASSSFALLTLDTQGEKTNLGVFPYVSGLPGSNGEDLFVQMSRTSIDSLRLTNVAARVSIDGGKPSLLIPFKYIPEEDVWRASIGHYNLAKTSVTYDVIAEDELTQKVYKDNYLGFPLTFINETAKKGQCSCGLTWKQKA
jgi:hypothetical protein